MEILDPLKQSWGTGVRKPFTWKGKAVIGVFVAFAVLFVLNLVVGVPSVATDPVDLGIEGKYFYWAHGWIMEVTYKEYIWGKILFFGMVTAFAVTFVGALILYAIGEFRKMEPRKQLDRKYVYVIAVLVFAVFFTVAGVMVYKARQEWATYPNPPVRPSKLMLDVESANRFFFQDFQRYPTTPDELVSYGHLHSSGAEALKGNTRLGGYRFTYTSDGTSYECVGQPPPGDPGAHVYFLSSRSGDIYCVFQNTNLDQLREAVSRRN